MTLKEQAIRRADALAVAILFLMAGKHPAAEVIMATRVPWLLKWAK